MSNNSHTNNPPKNSQGPPAWLFSNNSSNPSVSTSAPPNADTPTMAKKTQKAAKASVTAGPSASASASQGQVPPSQLMDLVESFLSDQGFDNAHREFQKHRAKKGWKEQGAGKKNKKKAHHSLVSVFQTWETFSSQVNTPVLAKEDPMEKVTKVSSSSSESDSSDDSSSESESDSDDAGDVAMDDAPAADESSSSESSSSEDSDSGDSESESDEEDAKPAKPAAGAAKNGVNPRKRKAESDSESSDSDSDEDMSDSSSDDKRPQTKKAKTSSSSDESSSSESSDSSDDESSEDEDDSDAKPKVTNKPKAEDDDSSSSESGSDSDDESDSESEEEPQVDLKVAAEVPLPDSDSDSSDSDSDSDSNSESDEEKPKPKAKNNAASGSGSDSSATLDKASPEFAPLPPDPNTLKANNRGKNGIKATRTQNQPFSRIRKDVTIDPRLSSNAYVTHGYGEKAHQDLIVTKGKGFTKEKNKKKRGSYKGGPLDVNMSRSIKFDD
ncbi:SRP40, C-terminal domain-containing protein [Hypoxylon trugodes]|uniref:SRP40, C-terminal domain-containing protein n=1 Tax=Hypoxylon trugodes TaxID=326681 RepID=UPI00219FB3A4|nr:SRP40, C-terminal domain-containing protein [Hypoxylon trugodes]KAI1387531.1 SRP40, C-terminal domain-containing protein [Hypoxylon trugodes]